jgi:gustatory receptor
MAIRISSFQEETSVSQNIFGWEWSIRPLIIWTRILGVQLPDLAYSKS